MTTEFDDNNFDRQMRQLHAGSLASLSPQTLARLRGARHAASQAAPARGRGWRWLAAGVVPAVLAVAIGVPFLDKDPSTVPAAGTAVATQPAADGDDYANALAENPDLYVWLASDGQQLAME